MISIEASIRTQLLTKATVTAIVGSANSARIRPYKLWQKDDIRTGPAIVIKVNTKSEEENTDLNCEGGLVNADISVMCVATELEDAQSLELAVKNNGTVKGSGLSHSEWVIEGSRNVQSCCYLNTTYDFVTFSDDSDEGFYFADAHYMVLYDELI